MQLTANGISMCYEVDGPGDGPVVVLSHSLATNLAMWERQLPALTPRYRVLRYDTRGHGRSAAPAGEYSLELLADDLFCLLDGLGMDQVHLVGLSMGGMIGQVAALRDPGRFASLVLCDTASQVPPAAHPAWRERIDTARSEGLEALVEPTIERWFSDGFQRAAATQVDQVRAMIRATPVTGYCGCAAAIMGLDLSDSLAAIQLPTLVMVGADDPGTPVAGHRLIHQRIVGSELVVIPDALHLCNIEQATRFNAALTGFLERQVPA